MQAEIQKIKKVSRKTTDALAGVHLQSFEGFFLSFMGKSFLKKMYQSYVEHDKSGVIVANIGENTVGHLAYSYDLGGLYKFMARRHTLLFAKSIVVPLLKNPRVVIKKIVIFLKKDDDLDTSKKTLKISSLCVLPPYQKKGIGTKLIKAFFNNISKDDYYISLDTDAINNDEVIRFYKANGFVEKRHFETPDGRKMIEFTINR